MAVRSSWLAFCCILSTLNISDSSVNTCREPSVKTTYQSSSLNAGTGSSRAVDGCTNQRYSSGCCMHTSVNGQVEAWWLVDFAEQIVVESIQIYYRDEGVSQQQSRFGGYQIFMTNTTSENLDISPCYQDTTSSRSAVDLTPTITACTGSTRYLFIYLDRNSLTYNWYSSSAIMELCEVLVYGCPVGKFGSGNCDLNCDSSCILNRCDPTNGVCTYCGDGSYKSGLTCSPCPSNCIGSTCNVETGECTACLTGYHGTLCDQLCPSGCKDNICDQMTGQCHDCNDGYFGPYCYPCSAGCSISVCDKTSGNCSPCFNGFFGSTCNQTCSVNCQNSVCGQLAGECEACVPGFYSSTCDQFCPSNCKDNTCNQLDGSCIACVPGYYGSSCDLSCPSNCKDNTCIQLDGLCTECNSGYYGSSCNQICPVNCKSTICNRSSGECTDCNDGTHGTMCDQNCPVQCKGGICNQLTGYCNECEAGVFGVLCDNSCSALCSSDGCSQETGFCTACTPGYYGQTCMENCGQCSSVSCNIADGTCDCSDGWEGDTCNTRKAVVDTPHNNTWTYVGGAIGAIIAIALLVAVFIVLKRRRQETSYQKNPPEIVDNTFDKVEMTPDIVPRQSMYDHTAARHTAATDENEIAYANVKDTAPRTEEEAAYHNFKAKAAYMSVHELQAIIDTKMANGAAGFQEEFKTFPTGAVFPHEEGKKAANKTKNRFKNTLPYDHSRVILGRTDGDVDYAYINANYIDGVDKPNVYIASQGPKPQTIDDFWRMVWQVGSGKIVMLTNLLEGQKTKCHKYWPDEGEALSIKNFDLKLDREREYAFYVIRDVSVFNRKKNQERQVHQFHFTTWPDHGTPDIVELVLFHRRVMSYKTQLTGQIVVHCSAGIGRTGTFIGLDALLTHWKKTGEMDIPRYLNVMRNNRMDMIQTDKQYIALHELLLEGFNLQESYISRTKFPGALETLCPKREKPTNQTKIFDEFEALQKCSPNLTPDCYVAALKKENKGKNRDLDVLAADRFRPFLQSQLSNRTDYINAVIIQSYTSKCGYLMTQFPLENTIDDFWTMVYDYDCKNVVVLGHPTENWLGDETSKTRAFSVKKVKDLSTESEVIVNEYKVLHVRSSRTTTVRIYAIPRWASDSLLPNSDAALLQLLEQMDSRRRSDDTIPVVVMCRDGCTQSGLFCCVSNARDQMKLDEEVDIFQTARQLKRRRPEALRNAKQYQYCYNIIGKYLECTNVYVN